MLHRNKLEDVLKRDRNEANRPSQVRSPQPWNRWPFAIALESDNFDVVELL